MTDRRPGANDADDRTDTTISRASQKSIAPPRPEGRLHVVHPLELARIIDVSGSQVVLGRQGEGDLAVRHQTVSRRHLELSWDQGLGRYVARDLGSHNGSAVDGVALAQTGRVLSHNGVVRMGDVVMVFEDGRALGVEDSEVVDRDAVPGQAAATRALRAVIAKAGADPANALLVGETGTGKERLAAEIHRLSGRRGAYKALNSAALNSNLVESQLFGHVRGAFTGSHGESAGMLRAAHGGTLFLDEIGELPLDLQPKLLRVLQEKEVLPVGGARAVKVDVRIVSATNRDLAVLMQKGEFRVDLYARLSMREIRVPALRDRRADILLWVRLLHERWLAEREQPGGAPLRLTADAAERLALVDWQLNLRGIDRFVHEHADSDAPISAADLPAWVKPGETPTPTSDATPARRLPAPNREELAEVLRKNNGSVRATAKHYGRDRRQIYRWLEAFGLKGSVKSDS